MSHMTRRDFVAQTAAVAGAGLLAPFDALAQTPVLARRPFGKTGVEVTLVGLGGGSRFCEPVKIDDQGAELVRRAIDSGIGFIETSANYGENGESERRIGLAMKTHRAKVFLETKPDRVERYGAPTDALARPDLPTYRDDLHYALSLPIATAVVGIDSLPTIQGAIENARSFRPLDAPARADVARRAQVFATTGYWVSQPRSGAEETA